MLEMVLAGVGQK